MFRVYDNYKYVYNLKTIPKLEHAQSSINPNCKYFHLFHAKIKLLHNLICLMNKNCEEKTQNSFFVLYGAYLIHLL